MSAKTVGRLRQGGGGGVSGRPGNYRDHILSGLGEDGGFGVLVNSMYM